MRAYFVGGPWNGEDRDVDPAPRITVALPSPGTIVVAAADIPSTMPALAVGEYELDPYGPFPRGHGSLLYMWRDPAVAQQKVVHKAMVGPAALTTDQMAAYNDWAAGFFAAAPPKPKPAGLYGASVMQTVMQKPYTHSQFYPLQMVHSMGVLAGTTAPVFDGDISVADPPELPVEETDEALVGYRCWDVVDGVLRSPLKDRPWPSPILRAEKEPCSYDPHQYQWKQRDDHCHGIYAWSEMAWPEMDYWGTCSMAAGRIEATGKCVVHERGFRAEAVRIEALVLSPVLIGVEGIVEEMEDRYQCEVGFDPSRLLAGTQTSEETP